MLRLGFYRPPSLSTMLIELQLVGYYTIGFYETWHAKCTMRDHDRIENILIETYYMRQRIGTYLKT